MGRNFKKLKSRADGFTLIEFLSVITVIGIFMGFLFPIGNEVIFKARMSEDANNLRQIALSYAFMTQDEDEHNWGSITSINDWAVRLASFGGINRINCYLSSLVCKKDDRPIVDKKKKVIGHFLHQSLSWVCLSPLPQDAPKATTPVLYSQGLDVNKGCWLEKSIYGSKGGFIVYLDGHVKFYSKLTNQLIDYETGRPTSRIQKAVPKGTHAYDSLGRLW